MRFGLERRLGLGILCVSGAIALFYFILMSVLFSRTYGMMATAFASKGKAEASALAARLPFALDTNDEKEIRKNLADFDARDAKGRSTIILDKKLSEIASSGPDAGVWTSFQDKIRAIQYASSWDIERFVISAAPSKNEDDLAGYVVTVTSLEAFLSMRSSLRNYAIGLFLIGILAIGLAANSLVKRSIIRPILSTAARLRDIAEGDGDLTQRLNVVTNDEIGELANQFNGFTEKLQKTIRGIAQQSQPLSSEAQALTTASESLQSSVNQTIDRATSVERAAQTMSSNTTTVASAVDTAMKGLGAIASAVEEMTSSIDEIATHSEQASNVTQDVVVQAKEIDQFMAELERSAQAIDKVTETITSISAQTNLLALNATIEAARAGAAGKGFAVVANEIKELAHQTASATEDVKERIKGIQASTQSALTGNARIATVITNINELVQSIANSISQQALVAKSIASDIASANSGVAQANNLVSDNAEVAHSIARDVSEVTATANKIRIVSQGLHQNSDRLSDLSKGLQDLVTSFRY